MKLNLEKVDHYINHIKMIREHYIKNECFLEKKTKLMTYLT